MNLLPHFGNCKKEIESLKEQLKNLSESNVNLMNDLSELSCKLRMASLSKKISDCSTCKAQESVAQENKSVVE